MRRTLMAVLAAILLAVPLTAAAGGYKNTTTTTSTTVYEETTTTAAEEPTTTVGEETTTSSVEETTTTAVEETTTTTEAPTGICVDPNTAFAEDLMLVQGIDRQMAFAIIATTSFDAPFTSITELQEAFGLGNQVLEPAFPDYPGYLSDECLSEGIVQPSTTTTVAVDPTSSSTIAADPTTTELEELPFTGMGGGQLAMFGSGALLLGIVLLRGFKREEDTDAISS